MTHASVFSGIGGPEVAATMLGWENLFHCEINPFGRQVLDYWYPNSKSYEDITTTDFTEWRGRVDVLTGGFPCQPFSYAGRRRGAEDDRYLWPSMYRAIDEIQPTWVVAENVAGILTMVEQGEVSKVAGTATLFDAFDDLRGRFELRETFTLQRICTDLESHGYAVQPVLVPACAVGAPHRRDRVFIVARRISNAAGHEHAADTIDEGLQGRHDCDTKGHGQDSNGCTRQLREVHDGERPTADTFGGGSASPSESAEGYRPRANDIQGKAGRREGHAPVGIDGLSSVLRNTADTDHDGRSACIESGRSDSQRQTSDGQGRIFQREVSGLGISWDAWGRGDGEYQVGERWANFPSVSPVHRGNDGLPFDVDRLTLSFGKWRTEALKAYGNAIVPQVMYEIFRAIEIVEQQNNEL